MDEVKGQSREDPLAAARNDPRVLYAAERTFLAWVRTGLALMGFGFVVARFGLFVREMLAVRNVAVEGVRTSLWVGVGFVLLGVVVQVAGAWRHGEILARLQPPMAADRRWSKGAAVLGFAMAASGVLLAGYLVYTG